MVVHEAGCGVSTLAETRTGGTWEGSKSEQDSRLTLVRRVPSLLFKLPLTGCIGLDDVDARGATGRLVPTPTAGEIDRCWRFGGGPNSAPGERRCELRIEVIVLRFVPPRPCASCVSPSFGAQPRLLLLGRARDLESVSFKVDGFGLWGGWGGMKRARGVGLRIGLSKMSRKCWVCHREAATDANVRVSDVFLPKDGLLLSKSPGRQASAVRAEVFGCNHDLLHRGSSPKASCAIPDSLIPGTARVGCPARWVT